MKSLCMLKHQICLNVRTLCTVTLFLVLDDVDQRADCKIKQVFISVSIHNFLCRCLAAA